MLTTKCDGCGEICEKQNAARNKHFFCSRKCRSDWCKRNSPNLFWRHVEKTRSCWLWTAFRDKDGYGFFRAATTTRAHRVAWELTHGPIPNGLHVLHNCPGGDNPACVNPAHLFLGTNLDNCQDASRKGRKLRGEQHPHCVWTEALVKELRQRFAHGDTVSALAREYQRSRYGIWAIVHRITWAHVT